MKRDPIVICGARRTPMGSFLGALSALQTPQLGAVVLHELMQQASVSPDQVDQVLMGCVLAAGLGQAPARQAALGAELPTSVACTTVNKMCGSGLEAICLGMDKLQAQQAQWVLAGGMESMSNAPYLLHRARTGYRMGHGQLWDHMLRDGLEDAYDGRSMGYYAEQTATEFSFTRSVQDEFALESVQRALAAHNAGDFKPELVPVTVPNRTQTTVIEADETPAKCRPDKIASLKPVFVTENGTVTAASSSSIADGAAAVLMTRESIAHRYGMPILARLLAYTGYAAQPSRFTSAPVHAVDRLQRALNWGPAEVDLYEINEAFAVVCLLAMQQLKLSRAQLNVNGGALALGHPIGASGARVLITLIHALRARSLRRGIASLCIGGGEALAIAVECEG